MLISQPGQALKEDRREESRRRKKVGKHPLFPEKIPYPRNCLCVCVYNLPCLLPLSLAAFPSCTILSLSLPLQY
jgi:hypothetical protein